MQKIVKQIAVVLAAAALSPIAAQAHRHEGLKEPFGHAVPAAAEARTVVLKAGTRYVNVVQGETVTFEFDGKRFTWQFDTLREGRIAFGAIAPAGMAQTELAIYVAPNPVYQN